jgi:hypothetical protein
MYPKKSFLSILVFLLGFGLYTGYGQELKGSFGFDVGYLFPAGDWKEHIYVENLNQFNGGILFGAELEFTFMEINFGIFYNYSRLDVSDWEEYVTENGEHLDAEASISYFGGLFKYYFQNTPPHFLNLDLGFGYPIFFSGHESYSSYSYDYDFINTKGNIALIAGLAYKYKMDERIALTIGTRIVFIPQGIRYRTGENHDILLIPSYLGLRYLF